MKHFKVESTNYLCIYRDTKSELCTNKNNMDGRCLKDVCPLRMENQGNPVETEMKKYFVSFYHKKSGILAMSEEIESISNVGIILKGKIKARGRGWKFDGRKHYATFREE